MIWIDYCIIATIGFSALISIIRGFVREALSLVAWGCAFVVASRFYANLAVWFTWFDDALIRNIVAAISLFIATLIVASIVSRVMGSLIERTDLSGIDRMLGVCFGTVRGILIVAAILFFLDIFTSFSQHSDWKQSQLIPQFSRPIQWFAQYLQSTSNFLSHAASFQSGTAAD